MLFSVYSGFDYIIVCLSNICTRLCTNQRNLHLPIYCEWMFITLLNWNKKNVDEEEKKRELFPLFLSVVVLFDFVSSLSTDSCLNMEIICAIKWTESFVGRCAFYANECQDCANSFLLLKSFPIRILTHFRISWICACQTTEVEKTASKFHQIELHWLMKTPIKLI